jgi:hypothetical protein
MGTVTAGRRRIPSSVSSAMTVVPSLRPKRRRNLAGITKVPRFPIRLDSEIDIRTSCYQKFRPSDFQVKGRQASLATRTRPQTPGAALLLLAVTLGSLTACGDGSPAAGGDWAVDTLDSGVVRTTNPGTPTALEGAPVALEPFFRLGAADGPEAEVFGQLIGVEGDEEGRIMVPVGGDGSPGYRLPVPRTEEPPIPTFRAESAAGEIAMGVPFAATRVLRRQRTSRNRVWACTLARRRSSPEQNAASSPSARATYDAS